MRRISEIKNLPISELSDEEIAKATMYRFNAKFAMIIYLDQEGQAYFIGRYKDSSGNRFYKQLIAAWEERFGKMRAIEDTEIEK